MRETWEDDDRTNLAIEHLHLMGAKLDADGRVVPRHRYTRKAERVFELLSTVAYQIKGEPAAYALEGSIAITGSLVQWFRDQLELIASAPESARR